MADVVITFRTNDLFDDETTIAVTNPNKARRVQKGGRILDIYGSDEGYIIPNTEVPEFVDKILDELPYLRYDRAQLAKFKRLSDTEAEVEFSFESPLQKLYKVFIDLWDERMKDKTKQEAALRVLQGGAVRERMEPEQEYAILIFERVIGKSKGPKGYDRFKPIPYRDASQEHYILYAMTFEGTHGEIRNEYENVQRDMLRIIRKTGKGDDPKKVNVIAFDDAVHNITTDETATGTAAPFNEPKLKVDNSSLTYWGVL